MSVTGSQNPDPTNTNTDGEVEEIKENHLAKTPKPKTTVRV